VNIEEFILCFSHSAVRNIQDSGFIFNLGFVKWSTTICLIVKIIALSNFHYSVSQKIWKKKIVY